MVAFSCQTKKLIVVTAAVVNASNNLFTLSAHAKTDDGEINNMDTAIPVGSSVSITPPRPTSSPSQLAADAGILFSAQARSSDEDKDRKKDRTTRLSRKVPLTYNAPPSQHAADTGILFSSNGAVAHTSAGADKDTVRTSSARTSNGGKFFSSSTSMMPFQQPEETACGTKGFVDCFNGRSIYYYSRTRTWYYDGYITCKEACNGACCISTYDPSSPTIQACEGFTGRVCKDGSCSGAYACYLAKIQLVVNSCIGGGACCEKDGYEALVSGSIINSCRGIGACQTIASRFQDGGEVSNVIDSCVGTAACVGLGMFGSVHGNVTNSCNGYGACFALGFNGTIRGNIENSCNNDTYTCAFMANGGSGGEVGPVINSCNAEGACRFAGSVTCLEFGNQYNCIGGYDGGGILTPMISCCNEKYACYSTMEATLPQQCRSPLTVRQSI